MLIKVNKEGLRCYKNNFVQIVCIGVCKFKSTIV